MPPLAALARTGRESEDVLQRRLVRSRTALNARTPWPELPMSGDLIAIADAKVKLIERRWYAVYVVLLRPVEGDDAVISKPLIRLGKEVTDGWYAALDMLPENVHKRVQVLVSDGHRGLMSYARRSGWKVQRCHFHLIASIQGRRSRGPRSMHQQEGARLYRLVTEIITASESTNLLPLISEIEALGWETTSAQLRKVISGFVTNVDDYRTYLRHPELRLPATSNTAESCIGTIHELCHRARGFRTPESFTSWIEALVKVRRTVKCNPRYQPN